MHNEHRFPGLLDLGIVGEETLKFGFAIYVGDGLLLNFSGQIGGGSEHDRKKGSHDLKILYWRN